MGGAGYIKRFQIVHGTYRGRLLTHDLYLKRAITIITNLSAVHCRRSRSECMLRSLTSRSLCILYVVAPLALSFSTSCTVYVLHFLMQDQPPVEREESKEEG